MRKDENITKYTMKKKIDIIAKIVCEHYLYK